MHTPKSVWLVMFCCAVLSAGAYGAGQATVGKGSGAPNDFVNIQTALDSFTRYDEIVVYAGSYEENVFIDHAVSIRGYNGPYVTCVDGKQHKQRGPLNKADQQQTIVVKERITGKVEIKGLYITNGYYGIDVGVRSLVKIANCVVHANDIAGIKLDEENITNPTAVKAEIYNNVLIENGDTGLLLNAYRLIGQPPILFLATVKNNIFVGNPLYAIAINGNPTANCDRLQISYNDYWLNGAKYSWPVPGCPTPGPGEIERDPLFVGGLNGCGLDVRLQAGSQCRDAGSPSAEFSDPDGSRNDMGAYGGPYAQTFYESALDGPIVQNINVTPGVVVKGQPLSVSATAAVR